MSPEITVDLQLSQELDSGETMIPSHADFEHWVGYCARFLNIKTPLEMAIRIVTADEIIRLNAKYRGQEKSTNVLSFPYEPLPGVDVPLLGDIVICAHVVNKEAVAQNKTALQHWAHMTIHAMLHLLGYDHIEEEQALRMEGVEIAILTQLNYSDPYADAEHDVDGRHH